MTPHSPTAQKKNPQSSPRRRADAGTTVLAGGGEMGARMRAFDWSQTPIGPLQAWPQSLKTAVRIILTSGYAMFVWWGRELINLYNDSYRSFLGVKHPDALGKSARDVWAEIWNQIGPRTDAVLLHGESTYDEALLLLMERHGYLEETYFTFSYSPLPDDKGGVGGLFCAVTEDTQRVIGERRLRLLREMTSAMAEGRTPLKVCQAATESLSSAQRDLPFSMIYLFEGDGKTLRRVSQAGIASGHPAAPDLVSLEGDAESVWPFRQVIESREVTLVEKLGGHFAEIPTGEWAYAPERAVLVAIAQQGQARPAGVLIAGLNPHRQFDDEFRGFVSLLTNQIAASIANAVAYDTERRRADELAQLDRAKTLFFSNVSHEFRTPLTLMLGPLESVLSQARGRLSDEDREQLTVARRNSLRLLKLVNTLLDFSRLEAGRVQALYEPTDLSAFTAEIASIFRSAMENAGLRFSVGSEPLPEPVYIDREMWEKIVLNLLSNAFKFTFEGEISVRVKSVGDAVELTVEDTGVGIPQDELQRVFERFHRIESARARTYEGTGIGLALVQELVKLHGGAVRVESAAGRGSAFIVSIPRGMAHLPPDRIQAQRALAPTMLMKETYVEEARRWLPGNFGSAVEGGAFPKLSLPAAAPDAAATKRELIVLADDNADMREYACRLLRGQYEVHAVANGEEAVEAIFRLRPALVLTDVMMPRLDGFGVLRAIRGDPALSGIPVILLSALAGEEPRIEGLQAGADDYLIKPFTARELSARVGTHIRMARIRRDAVEREVELRAQAESERHRLQELLAQAPALIGFMSGPDHRWTYVNDLCIQVTGRKSAEEFIGRTMRESLPEMEGQGLFELLDQAYQTGQPSAGREMKVRFNRSASGQAEEAYLNFIYQPIGDAGGRIDGILLHAVEVTDQVAARKAIAMSEERLRLAQTAAQIGTWEWDAAHDTRTLSPELHRIFGTDPGDPRYAQVWESRVHPEDWKRVSHQMEAGSRSGSMEFEYRYHHPDRGLRWFFCKGRRLEDDETRMLGVLLDITSRKQVAEAHERLAAIVESSDDAIVGKDLNGIVTSWNAGAEGIFGYRAEEIIGRSILAIVPAELHGEEERILQTIRRGERIHHYETVRVTKGGERISVSLTVSPVRDGAGRIVGAAKIARNITEQKKIEQTLHTAERLASVGRLAATIAHEINNPLEAVTNLVYLAKANADQKVVQKYLSGAEEELERISQLTKQTLGFYRNTKGAAPLRVGPLIEALLSVFSPRIRNRSIELQPEIRQDPEIVAVPGEIRQLLANLLGNSIDAVEGGGFIRIRLSAATERNGEGRQGVRLTVADSGPGIPLAIRSKLFEPFFTTKKDVGTGLGLWVCKSIVEKHGGSLRLQSSTQLGRSWTAFSVFLPCNPPSSLEQNLRQER